MSSLLTIGHRCYAMLENWKGAEYIEWMKSESPHFPLLVALIYVVFTLLVPRLVQSQKRTAPVSPTSSVCDPAEKLPTTAPAPGAVETVEIQGVSGSSSNNLAEGAATPPSSQTHRARRSTPRAEPLVSDSILKPVIAAWNLALSIFSVAGFVCTAPILYRIVVSDLVPGLAPKFDAELGQLVEHPKVPGGLYTSLCYWNANIFQDGVSGFWLLWFDLSKIPEMMDTVFLILQGKPVAFIHWYHHITVMLFCWHAHVTYISNGLWFATMNMGVHSIMYFYYFMCAIGLRKMVRRFAPLITMMQLAQMVAGLVLVSYTGYLHWTHPKSCETNSTSIVFGLCMYGSYFLLFVKFFRDAYMAGSRDKRRTRPSTPPSS